MNRYLAECLGTFTLVFAGCGAIITNDLFPDTLGHVGVSMSFGLVVMAMIYAVGNVSGAHLNPAVTLGFVVAGRMKDYKAAGGYILAQVFGAIVAALLLKLILPAHPNLGATLPGISIWGAFLFEIVLTFILMFVILNVSAEYMEKGMMAGVAVGGTVGLEALFAGPLTGASMNPARSLGPALVSGEISVLWLYLLAPVVGAILAAPMCRWIQGERCCGDEGCS